MDTNKGSRARTEPEPTSEVAVTVKPALLYLFLTYEHLTCGPGVHTLPTLEMGKKINLVCDF